MNDKGKDIDDLLEIFSRMKTRVKHGSSNYNLMKDIIVKRAEAEEKFSDTLKSICSEKHDEDDTLLKNFIDFLKKEAEEHLTLAQKLKSELITPHAHFSKTLKDNKKQMTGLIDKETAKLTKVESEVKKHKKNLDDQVAKSKSLSGAKLEAMHKKTQKLAEEYNKSIVTAQNTTESVNATSLPFILSQFKQYDSSRLNEMQFSSTQFGKLSIDQYSKLNSLVFQMQQTATYYNATDKSKRYASRIIDTDTVDELKEEESIIVIAIADYVSNEEYDLEFTRGDVIKVSSQSNSGWWEGSIGDRRGFFPSTYVMFPNNDDPTAVGAVCLVADDYRAEDQKQVNLLSGDLVYVDRVKNGICYGKNLRTEKEGTFPLQRIQMML